MHLGRNNPKHKYSMAGQQLEVTEEERDIGVLVTNNLKPSRQCTESAARANRVLYQLTKVFHYRDKNTFIKLYKQYVRPHLEYSIQAWNPWLAGDIEVLENVQRKAVRMVSGLNGLTYEDKLRELNLESLAARQKRLDMIQTFKIIKGIDNVDDNIWFTKFGNDESRRYTRLSEHPLNLRAREPARTDIRRNFFSNRVINDWNGLPSTLKDSRTISGFKFKYSEFTDAAAV